MMESAPLTLAQTHARNAGLETKRSNPVAASEEHDLAAAEFAAAAQLTKDNEALRILNLLEQHHKKLGQILKSRHTANVPQTSPMASEDQNSSKVISLPPEDSARVTSPETPLQPPRLVRTGKPTARDLSSSIASNLASARGIPSNKQKRSAPISPLVSNQHADGRILQDEDGRSTHPSRNSSQVQSRRGGPGISSRPSWAPPPDVNEAAISTPAPVKADPTTSDAPFQQFYSTFESLMTKLSAPLAFAGLPLTSQSPTPAASTILPPKSQSSKPSPISAPPTKPLDASVDYSQLISRAALRAVSRSDKTSRYGNPAESFYVVPTTGGTTSYAEIMTRADREASYHRRKTSNLSTSPADDSEDASSTILPAHLVSPPSRPGLSNERKFNGKTMEELSLENKALKHLSDTLSKRLHVFEMSAQTSSAALAQSIRSLHLSPLNTPENSRGKATTAFSPDFTHGNSSSSNANASVETARLKSRIAELEEIMKKSDAKAKKREDENVKLRDTLGKYRDKWDSLKAGAKARRERATGVGMVEAAGGSTRDDAAERGKGKDRDRERDGDRERDKSSSEAGTGTEKDDLETEGDGIA